MSVSSCPVGTRYSGRRASERDRSRAARASSPASCTSPRASTSLFLTPGTRSSSGLSCAPSKRTLAASSRSGQGEGSTSHSVPDHRQERLELDRPAVAAVGAAAHAHVACGRRSSSRCARIGSPWQLRTRTGLLRSCRTMRGYSLASIARDQDRLGRQPAVELELGVQRAVAVLAHVGQALERVDLHARAGAEQLRRSTCPCATQRSTGVSTRAAPATPRAWRR